MKSPQKITKGIILVAGLGTRFLPATKAQPKEMLPVLDKPVVQYIVEEMIEAGIKQIIFVTSSSKRAIEDHFDRNFELEYRLKEKKKFDLLEKIRDISGKARFIYTRQWSPKGNGDALLFAKEIVGDEYFVLSEGDSIIDAKPGVTKQLIDEFEKRPGTYAGVTKIEKKLTDKYGIVSGKKIAERVLRVQTIIEKPKPKDAPSDLAANGMRYILSPKIFTILKNLKPGTGNEIQVADAVNKLAQTDRVFAYIYRGKYHDTGNKISYIQCILDLSLKHREYKKEMKKYMKNLRLS